MPAHQLGKDNHQETHTSIFAKPYSTPEPHRITLPPRRNPPIGTVREGSHVSYLSEELDQ